MQDLSERQLVFNKQISSIHTNRSEKKLIESNSLQRRDHGSSLGNRESAVQEAKPLVLDRRHEETVGHEAGQALKVEWWRELLGVGNEIARWPGVFLGEFLDFDREEIVLVAFAGGALLDGGQALRHGICDATQHLRCVISLQILRCESKRVVKGIRAFVRFGVMCGSKGAVPRSAEMWRVSYSVGDHGSQYYRKVSSIVSHL